MERSIGVDLHKSCFTVCIYRTLKYNWVFEDFSQFKLAVNH